MRVAVVHHWFVTRGGGERVAECIASLFPSAEILTLFAEPAAMPESLRARPLHTSFLNRIGPARRFHRHMMPLFPLATESLDLRGFDLVLSSDSATVKGVWVDPGTVHLCYCHSPMRYLWDSYEAYRAQMGPITRAVFSATAGYVRRWDVRAAGRVTHLLANSRYVAGRIQRFYGRDSTVIHPPIDLTLARRDPHPGEHYLCAGRLVGYKRTELLIEACARLGRRLRIVGAGPEEARLRRLAGAQVEWMGELPNDELWSEYASCRALLFAADEDFGMVPLEAQACGRPVIAFGAGGSLETVRGTDPGRTGVYFGEQTVESVMDAIVRFEGMEAAGAFDPERIAEWAGGFGTPVFLRAMRRAILAAAPAAESSMIPESPV